MTQLPFNIEFDEATHTYTVNGEVKLSVTQVLREAGILDGYADIPQYYADRGTAVHDYCTLYAQGWLDFDDVRDDCIDYVRTFETIMFELSLKYIAAGEPSYDEEYDICGTPDLIMEWDGKRTLVELKTGVAPMWLGLQCAAYDRMGEHDAILGLELKTGKVYTKADDFVRNYAYWDDINNDNFDYDEWKSDRKRRRMKVLRRAA